MCALQLGQLGGWEAQRILAQDCHEFLGEGAHARAFAARWQGKEVVIKVSKTDWFSLQREADFLFRLRGLGGAPTLLAVCLMPPMLIMTRAPGRTLWQVLQAGDVSDHFKVLCAQELSRKLCQMHEAGIIHNDIKGDNILVNKLGEYPEVTVIDFGLATLEGHSLGLVPDPVSESKAFHVAPELWRGAVSTSATDRYSLGFVFEEISSSLSTPASVKAMTTLSTYLRCRDPLMRPPFPVIFHTLDKEIVPQSQTVSILASAFQWLAQTIKNVMSR